MSARRPPPKPVPMRWIVLAIVVFAVIYTFLRLYYGKRGKAFEPFHDIREQATTQRLLGLGYRRIPANIERRADPLHPAQMAREPAEVINALGGLPDELDRALVLRPTLPATIESVVAPRNADRTGSYTLQFTCSQPDYRTQIRGVTLYRKDRWLYLLPDFEPMSGQLLARWKESVVLASFATQSLAPGRYTITLCGSRGSKSWDFVVP